MEKGIESMDCHQSDEHLRGARHTSATIAPCTGHLSRHATSEGNIRESIRVIRHCYLVSQGSGKDEARKQNPSITIGHLLSYPSDTQCPTPRTSHVLPIEFTPFPINTYTYNTYSLGNFCLLPGIGMRTIREHRIHSVHWTRRGAIARIHP